MDPFSSPTLNSSDGFDLENLENQYMAEFPNRGLGIESTSGMPSSDPKPFLNESDDNPGYCDFFDDVLAYIDEILMEEDLEDKTHLVVQSADFQEKERSFYEIIGQKYPSPHKDDRYEGKPNNNDSYATKDYGIPASSYGQAVWNFEAGVVIGGDSFPSRAENTAVKTRRKKNHDGSGSGLEEEDRSNKQPVIFTEPNLPIEDFGEDSIFTITQHEDQNTHGKGKKKHVVDFETLLIGCAESISSGDHYSSNKLLKNIRKHASPYGNGSQRLAHYVINGLEARLAGIGPTPVRSYSISDYLKAYRSSLISSAFLKLTDYAMNNTIAIRSAKAARVHVIDFGILYGFQWPAFIKCLAEREGGPPKLRITGVDAPRPGSGPAEVVEQAGRWLTRYAEKHNVPFEYNSITQKWELVKLEDLKIEEGEFLAVNCKIRAMCLTPEMGGEEESPRAHFLEMVKKINPDIFVHGVANAALASTAFMPRFREILSHFSALFDMLEMTLPREQADRVTMEQMLGKEMLDLIAFEATDRVQRPETYRSWAVRHVRAGFEQVHFDGKLMDGLACKVRSSCPREFLVEKDKEWLLMSWKGRILLAVSCWQPV